MAFKLPVSYSKPIKQYGALIIILLIAAWIRLNHLDQEGLWADEIITAIFSDPANRLNEVIAGPVDTPLPTPPLWFLITHYFLKLSGLNDAYIRVPAAIAGVVGIWAVYLLGRYLFNRNVGLISAGILTLIPLHVFVSREGRFYAAVSLLATLSYYYFHRGLRERKISDWVGYSVITLLGIYTHLTMFFVPISQALFVLILLVGDLTAAKGWSKRFKKVWASIYLPFGIGGMTVALFYIPMISPILKGLRGPRGFGAGEAAEGFEFTVAFFLDMFANFGAGPKIAFGLFFASAVWGLTQNIKKYPGEASYFITAVFTPVIIIQLAQPKHWFAYKYLISLMPFYIVMVAAGVERLAEVVAETIKSYLRKELPRLENWVLVILALGFAGLSVPQLPDAIAHREDRWERQADLLSDNVRPGDVIVTFPSTILTLPYQDFLGYYYQPLDNQVPMIQAATMDDITSLLDRYQRLWLMMDRRADREIIWEIVSWIPTQPRIELSINNQTSIIMIAKDKTQRELLEEIAEFDPLLAEVQGSLGHIYLSLKEYQESINAYQAAIALEPDEGIWNYHLGVVYEKLGDPRGAEANYLIAINKQADVSGFHGALADFYNRRKRVRVAIKSYSRAISLWRSQFISQPDSVTVETWQFKLRELQEK